MQKRDGKPVNSIIFINMLKSYLHRKFNKYLHVSNQTTELVRMCGMVSTQVPIIFTKKTHCVYCAQNEKS